MSHENNGHGQSHDHDETEGSRQYYPKGWFIPLAGLAVVALGLILIAGWAVGHSGTDKWGNGSATSNNAAELRVDSAVHK